MQRRSSETSNDGPSISTHGVSKTDVLLQQFYSKTAQMIIHARSCTEDKKVTSEFNMNRKRTSRDGINSSNSIKTNKWFGIETIEDAQLRATLRFWKAQLSLTAQAPALVIEISLNVGNLPVTLHTGTMILIF